MRIAFGILGLLIVLAIVGTLAKKQLQAVRVPLEPPAAASAAAPNGTVADRSRQLQRTIADDVNRLMQQAPARIDGASQ